MKRAFKIEVHNYHNMAKKWTEDFVDNKKSKWSASNVWLNFLDAI